MSRGKGAHQNIDMNPAAAYVIDRQTQVRAVMVLLAHDAADLIPMLFAPPGMINGRCPDCSNKIHYGGNSRHATWCARRV